MLVGNALNKLPALHVLSSHPAVRARDMGPQRQVTSLGSQSSFGSVSVKQDCCSRHKISTILHFIPKASLRPTTHDGSFERLVGFPRLGVSVALARIADTAVTAVASAGYDAGTPEAVMVAVAR